MKRKQHIINKTVSIKAPICLLFLFTFRCILNFLEYIYQQNKIVVNISDTGDGIDRSIIRNIFKPGVTSKKRGWGLGLSLSKRIIEEYHKGSIFVMKSEKGKGTTFTIRLPKNLNSATS